LPSFADEGNPAKGFVFDGRIAEDFKLSSGTWASVGPLRARFIAHCAPYVQDVVITGHDRDYLGALIFPTAEGRELKDAPKVFGELLRTFAVTSSGSSNRIAAAILLEEPPSLDLHEITDKGNINQRAPSRQSKGWPTNRTNLRRTMLSRKVPAFSRVAPIFSSHRSALKTWRIPEFNMIQFALPTIALLLSFSVAFSQHAGQACRAVGRRLHQASQRRRNISTFSKTSPPETRRRNLSARMARSPNSAR
jgi:hypothetical protein